MPWQSWRCPRKNPRVYRDLKGQSPFRSLFLFGFPVVFWGLRPPISPCRVPIMNGACLGYPGWHLYDDIETHSKMKSGFHFGMGLVKGVFVTPEKECPWQLQKVSHSPLNLNLLSA